MTERDRLTRRLLVCGLVAGPFFTALVILQSALRPDHDLRYDAVSALALGPYGWVQVVTFIVTGSLAVAFAVGADRLEAGTTTGKLLGGKDSGAGRARSGDGGAGRARGRDSGPGSAGGEDSRTGHFSERRFTAGRLIAVLIGMLGVGLVGTGVFVVDPADAPRTWVGALHDLFSAAAVNAGIVACLVDAYRCGRQRRWGWAVYGAATAMVGFALGWPRDPATIGLRQTALAVLLTAWVSLLALRLRRATR